jgi:hypothetical protein
MKFRQSMMDFHGKMSPQTPKTTGIVCDDSRLWYNTSVAHLHGFSA